MRSSTYYLVELDGEETKPVPLATRLAAIEAIYRVYADFVAPPPPEADILGNCFYMWFNAICFDFGY